MELNPLQIILGFFLSVILGLISYRLKALTYSGVIGLICIGTIVFGSGGIRGAVPLLFFYISSSLISKIRTASKDNALQLADKTGPRDIRQVLANGGIAALAILIYSLTEDMLWYFLFLAALAEATADTWATEIGTLSHRQPISIMTLQKVDAGQSGGITIIGTIAALTGAILTTLSGLVMIESAGEYNFFIIWIIIGGGGWLGSTFDSILGASIQVQYKCSECGGLTEKKMHCRKTAQLWQGWKLIDNDMVNFLGTLLAAVLALVLLV